MYGYAFVVMMYDVIYFSALCSPKVRYINSPFKFALMLLDIV